MLNINDMMNQVKIFFDKGFDRIKKIFKPKIVENLTAGKENLAMSLVDQQNKLKEMVITDVGILSIMEQDIQDYCKELIVMKVDGYERYQELLDTTPTILNAISIQERLSKILKNLQTSTVLGQITPERKDYEEKFSPFFNEIFDKNLDKFPENSTKRIMLPIAILPYIDKNNPIDTETMKSIKAHTHYKKSQIIEYLKSKCLPILEQKKVEGKVTEQDVSPEDYNNKITLFWKGIEEYKKQPGSKVIRYGDQSNIKDDTKQSTYNNDKIIQSIVLMPPRVNITYTTQDKPNETQQGDISMNTGFRNLSIGD